MHASDPTGSHWDWPPRGHVVFRLLGTVEAVLDGRVVRLGAGKQRALLALLALRANTFVSRDFLIDRLWGERAPASANHTLVVYMSRLRKAIRACTAEDVLRTEAGGYMLRIDPGRTDVWQFERALEEGRDALARGEAARAGSALRGALELWRGDALADLAFEPFAEPEAARLEQLRLTALESRIDADLACGRHVELVGELEALVRKHPLNERLRGQLMLALYRSGRQAAALEVYRETRRLLVDDLGIEPGIELQRLEQAVLRHEPTLEAPAAVSDSEMPSLLESTAPVPGGRRQRKTVSVVLGTAVRLPSSGRRLDPESLDLAMTRYFQAMKEAIEHHGGRSRGSSATSSWASSARPCCTKTTR